MNKAIGQERDIAKAHAGPGANQGGRGDGGFEQEGICAYDLFTTPHTFAKIARPVIGQGFGGAGPKQPYGGGPSKAIGGGGFGAGPTAGARKKF